MEHNSQVFQNAPLSPDKSTSAVNRFLLNRVQIVPEKGDLFDPLQDKVQRIAGELEEVTRMLEARGLESYFHSLVDQFCWMAVEFKKRLDGMMGFVTFLNQHNVPISSANAGYFAVLPEEVIFQIMSFFNEKELNIMASLSTEWKRLAEDNVLWKRLSLRRWHKRKPVLDESKLRSWKNYFLQSARVDQNWKHSNHAVHSLEHGSAVLCVSFNENKIVSGSADETIKVWDVKTKKCLHTLSGHVYTVKSLQFDDEKIISGGGTRDKSIKIWNINTGECTDTIEGHAGGIFTLQYDDEKIISGATDHNIRVWSMKSKKCIKVLSGHQHDVYCLQYDKHGRLVSGAGSGDKTVRVWDLYTEQCVQEIKGHRGGVFCLYFDRSCVVSGSKGEIKVWDLNTGTCMHTLDKHNAFVLGLQFDDTRMVSGGYDEDFAVKVWDLRMMSMMYKLKDHNGNIRTVRFDEGAVVSGAADKTVKVWDFSAGR